MGNQIASFELEDGGVVLIEAQQVEEEIRRVGIGDQAIQTFDAAWDSVLSLIHSINKRFQKCGPSETQVKFGVKVGSDLNMIVAGSKAEASFEVTLTWKAKDGS